MQCINFHCGLNSATHRNLCLLSCLSMKCGVSDPHKSEGHVHEPHGHKTATSSGHGGEREEEEHKGISSYVL